MIREIDPAIKADVDQFSAKWEPSLTKVGVDFLLSQYAQSTMVAALVQTARQAGLEGFLLANSLTPAISKVMSAQMAMIAKAIGKDSDEYAEQVRQAFDELRAMDERHNAPPAAPEKEVAGEQVDGGGGVIVTES